MIWIYLRHYINLHILWSTLTEFRTIGLYELNWEGQQYKSWFSQVITFTLLASLQAVNLFWLFLILRIAKNYIIANLDPVDVRSDIDGEDENDDDDHVDGDGDGEEKKEKKKKEAKQKKLAATETSSPPPRPRENGVLLKKE